MRKMQLLGAAGLLTAMIATPAMAQQAVQEPGAYRQAHPWSNDYYYGYRPSGFWPADVAAGVVGGAIGTAEVIATAPFRGPYYGDSYAYYGNRPVARACGVQPGATYMGPDGRWYPC
jgi:hypothetical protein